MERAFDDGNGEDRNFSWVYVHGLASVKKGMKSDVFAKAVLAQERDAVFTRYDCRGHGDSDGSMEQISLSTWIQDLKLLLERLNEDDNTPKRSHILVGSSFGGLASAWLGATEPSLVRGLVLLAPAFGMSDRLQTLQKEQARPDGAVVLPSSFVEGGIRLGARMVDDLKHGQYSDEHELSELLQLRRVPIYIAHGVRDDAVPWESSEQFYERVKTDTGTNCLLELWLDGHRLNRAMCRPVHTPQDAAIYWMGSNSPRQ